MKEIYINKTGNSNKFWSYEVNKLTVNIEYGRVGLKAQKTKKSFANVTRLNNFIAKKIAEKLEKGYKKETVEKLGKETTLAKQIGVTNKISKIQWVDFREDCLTCLNEYDPDKAIYVEITNSWSGYKEHLLLTKTMSYKLSGVRDMGNIINYGSCDRQYGSDDKIKAIRHSLKSMYKLVSNIMKTVKFGAIGARSLFGSSNSKPSKELNEALNSIDTAGFSKSVVNTFATMGSRKLSL